MDLKAKIRTIPHWPSRGVMFRDITPLLEDAEAFRHVEEIFFNHYKGKGITAIVAIESRGFLFAAPLALRLGVPLALVRKPGKLPYKTESVEYEKEYGKDRLEMHSDALKKGDKVLIVDDLIATGGTALGTAQLCERLGAKVEGFAFLIGLPDLKGMDKLKAYDVFTIMTFEGE